MPAPVPPHLLPDNASIRDGELMVGGVAVSELAAEFGTPLFVYDEDHLRARCREAVETFGEGVAYATKAFLCVAMAKLAHEEGMHLDVATLGELHVADVAGVPAASCVLHGNNKSSDELRTAMERGVGRIVIDSFDELDRIDAIHTDTGLVAQALLRITPGVEAHTHEFISTGQDDSKFGFTVSTGLADKAIERASGSPAINLHGIHAHIGSQVFAIESLRASAQILGEIAARYGLPELSVGGGLGVAYVTGEEGLTISQWGKAVLEGARASGADVRISAEPGRSIVATAGLTVYTIGTIKQLDGIRTYVAVDGGMSDNPRPVLYDSGYECLVATSADAERDLQVRVVGKHCESGDIVVREGHLPGDVSVGDLLVTPVTGAYGQSLASNYNKVPRPAVVFVRDGEARVVVRRETLDDLVRLDQG
ncbi:MAG: diaminopimelate decarboxylase [Actinomycetota bacterium]